MAVVQQQPADLTLNKYSLEYHFEELQHATQNFDPQCRLGSGAFGAVFRGIQADGTEVAVKVLDLPEEAGFEEEVRVLSKFRHPNLVILMGFARHGPQRLLVYELLGGGDVYRRLQRSISDGLPFPWRQRASAAFDAACGLSHLHHATPKVFHRDIKSANILLDRNGTAKMADFGLACLSHAKAHRVENAAGTVGYACPLYAHRRMVTEGSEVYSFGIVLLELLTASPPAWILHSPDGSREYQFLAAHIRGDVGIAMSLADLEARWPQQVACAVADLALRCTQLHEDQRPKFVDVVNSLRTMRDAPEQHALQRAEPQVLRRTKAHAQLLQGPPAPVLEAVHAPVQQDAVAQGIVGDAQASPAVIVLWSLACTFAEGLDVDALPHERRTLVHRHTVGCPVLGPLKVGRLLQEDFFNALVTNEANLAMVSGEHFQVWAVEAQGTGMAASAVGGVPCLFFLTNVSCSWTMVNGTLLDVSGKHTRLHHGDRIVLGRRELTAEGLRYTPIIQFRFDLKGSVLRDADALEAERSPALAAVAAAAAQAHTASLAPPAGPATTGAATPRQAGADTPRHAGAGTPRPAHAAPEILCRGTSLAGDVLPRFLLQIGGGSLREGVEDEQRLIVHGPALRGPGQSEVAGHFSPLVLGRGNNSCFWKRLLRKEALGSLAWEHLVLEACGGLEHAGGAPVAVTAKSLSTTRPVRVCSGGLEAAADGGRMLEPDERQVLRHGDVVVLMPGSSSSLWLTFLDLTAPGPAKAGAESADERTQSKGLAALQMRAGGA